MAVGNPLWSRGLVAGAGTVIGLAQLPPTRKALLKLKSPGDGPTA